MSPLAPNSEQIVGIPSASDDINAIDNILEDPANTDKISYSTQELLNLRFKNNEAPKVSENRFVERNSFMTAFPRFAPLEQRTGDQQQQLGAQNKTRDIYRGAQGTVNRCDSKHGNRQTYRSRSSWHGNTRGESPDSLGHNMKSDMYYSVVHFCRNLLRESRKVVVPYRAENNCMDESRCGNSGHSDSSNNTTTTFPSQIYTDPTNYEIVNLHPVFGVVCQDKQMCRDKPSEMKAFIFKLAANPVVKWGNMEIITSILHQFHSGPFLEILESFKNSVSAERKSSVIRIVKEHEEIFYSQFDFYELMKNRENFLNRVDNHLFDGCVRLCCDILRDTRYMVDPNNADNNNDNDNCDSVENGDMDTGDSNNDDDTQNYIDNDPNSGNETRHNEDSSSNDNGKTNNKNSTSDDDSASDNDSSSDNDTSGNDSDDDDDNSSNNDSSSDDDDIPPSSKPVAKTDSSSQKTGNSYNKPVNASIVSSTISPTKNIPPSISSSLSHGADTPSSSSSLNNKQSPRTSQSNSASTNAISKLLLLPMLPVFKFGTNGDMTKYIEKVDSSKTPSAPIASEQPRSKEAIVANKFPSAPLPPITSVKPPTSTAPTTPTFTTSSSVVSSSQVPVKPGYNSIGSPTGLSGSVGSAGSTNPSTPTKYGQSHHF